MLMHSKGIKNSQPPKKKPAWLSKTSKRESIRCIYSPIPGICCSCLLGLRIKRWIFVLRRYRNAWADGLVQPGQVKYSPCPSPISNVALSCTCHRSTHKYMCVVPHHPRTLHTIYTRELTLLGIQSLLEPNL